GSMSTTSSGMDGVGGMFMGAGTGQGGSNPQGEELKVEPSDLATVTVTIGQPPPVVTYSATVNGRSVNAGWSVDRGNIGTVPVGTANMAVFTPKGTTGGLVTVQAGWNGQIVKRQILVKLVGEQNGVPMGNVVEQAEVATDVLQLTAGGGIGGV